MRCGLDEEPPVKTSEAPDLYDNTRDETRIADQRHRAGKLSQVQLSKRRLGKPLSFRPRGHALLQLVLLPVVVGIRINVDVRVDSRILPRV